MAISSYNTQFLTTSAPRGELLMIGEVTAISFSGIGAAEIDVTQLSNTTKSYVLGTTDGGTVEVTCNMTNAAPTLPVSGNASPHNFLLRFGGNVVGYPTASFTAYVAGASFEASVDQQVTTTYTLRLTGPITMGTVPAP
jgi:hypothetical protein